MQQITLVNDKPLQVKEWQGQRVVTFKDIDSLHQRPEGTARRNFNKNRKHFILGEDFFTACADEIRTHKIDSVSPKAHEDMILITESGYLMLVKSFRDDLAWGVQRALVNSYFKGKINPPQTFLERCGAVRPAPPEPTPEETAALFLKAIEEALQSGAYYLRPAYHQRGALASGECLGHCDGKYIALYAGAARAVWAAFMELNASKVSAGKSPWKALRAAGLVCSEYKFRVNGKKKCVYKLSLSAIDAITGKA